MTAPSCNPLQPFKDNPARLPEVIVKGTSIVEVVAPDYQAHRPLDRPLSTSSIRIKPFEVLTHYVVKTIVTRGQERLIAEPVFTTNYIQVGTFEDFEQLRPTAINMGTYTNPQKKYPFSLDFGKYSSLPDECDDGFFDFGNFTDTVIEQSEDDPYYTPF